MMKKIIVKLYLIFCIINAGYGQASLQVSGRLKVSIDHVKCINKSYDGVVEFDGHGNEISVTYSYRIYHSSNPSIVKKGADGTVIYGSNVNGMTRAGTQTPDLGGIKNGDVVNIYKPIIDEQIGAYDYIIIAPTVWEWDEPQKNTITGFNAQLEADLDWAMNQPYPFPDATINRADPFKGRFAKIFHHYKYGPALKYEPFLKETCCPGNKQGNRPIGMYCGIGPNICVAAYPPPLLILDTRVLSAMYLNNQRVLSRTWDKNEIKPAFIYGTEMNFTEESYNVNVNNGIYSVLLKIEFIPDFLPSFAPAPASTLSAGTTTGNNQIKKLVDNKTPKTLTTGNNNLVVMGNWAGTKTNDYGLYPENFGFELNANNEFLVKDANGTVAAKGTYSFSNNAITGTYKQFSSGESFSFTGSYDPATQKMICTQGSGTSTTGQGKWAVTIK